jgi:hypothetical protein
MLKCIFPALVAVTLSIPAQAAPIPPTEATDTSNRNSAFDKDSGTPTKCYVVTRDDIRYGERPGTDPVTGRECRPVSAEVLERIRAYRWGNRPKKIQTPDPTFFSLRTGEPIVWYHTTDNSRIDLFDLMGFDPDTGDELLPITREVVVLWRKQEKQRKEEEDRQKQEEGRRAPEGVDPDKYTAFDPLTGRPRVWYSRNVEGEYHFYDNPGYDPRTGEPLAIITHEVLGAWRNSLQERASQKCYVITQDPEVPVQYRDQVAGTDLNTGRQCRRVTSEVVARLREYEKGKRPNRIESAEPTFFDPRSGEAIIW